MVIYAKLKVEESGRLETILNAFFIEGFNPNGYFCYENGEIDMEVSFEDRPQETIIKALKEYNIKLLKFGKRESSELKEEAEPNVSAEKVADNLNNEQEVIVEEVVHSGNNEIVPDSEQLKPKKQVKENDFGQDLLKIPEIKKALEDAKTFEEFLKAVVSLIEVPEEKIELFIKLLLLADGMRRVSWKDIEAVFEKNKIKFNTYDRKILTEAVTGKLNIPFLKFIKGLLAIKSSEYFEKEGLEEKKECEPEETNRASECGLQPEEHKSNITSDVELNNGDKNLTQEEPQHHEEKNQGIPYFRVLSCMPDCKYPENMPKITAFEENLLKIDKSAEIKDRVDKLLAAMEYVADSENDEVNRYVCLLMQLKVISTEDVSIKRELKRPIRARMKFMESLTKIVKLYDLEAEVKIADFLENIRLVIMTDDELKKIRG